MTPKSKALENKKKGVAGRMSKAQRMEATGREPYNLPKYTSKYKKLKKEGINHSAIMDKLYGFTESGGRIGEIRKMK